MKKRFLVTMAFMLVIVCSIFAVSKIMAATCYDLYSAKCTSGNVCQTRCTPDCGGTAKTAFVVDKCCTTTTGYDTCEAHPTDKVDCFMTFDCEDGTSTCYSDAAEKQCDNNQTTSTTQTSKKILSGSGCGT